MVSLATIERRLTKLEEAKQKSETVRANIGVIQPVKMSLAEFFRQSWIELEPSTELLWNWHLEVICDHAQELFYDWLKRREDATYIQRARNLLVNVPPGSAKSRIVSVCFPAWIWTQHPGFKMIFLSANPRVALRDSVLCRDLIESDWYQKVFKPAWGLRDDQNAKSSYWNSVGGFRNAGGFDSRITGDRADLVAWDDPHDAEEVNSDSQRLHVLERWDNAIRNRINDPQMSIRLGIMQRLHTDDLSGHVLNTGEWAHLCIPQEYEGESEPTFIGWLDPRTELGELMFSDRFSRAFVEQEKSELGSYGYAGQHQQRPSPRQGGYFKRDNWKLYKQLPAEFDQVIQSWDCTFKDTKTADFVVGQVLGRKGGEFWLIDQVRSRMDINATLSAVRSLSYKYPQATAKLVEDKANGSAVIDLLQREIPGLIPIKPEGGKIVRAVAIAPYVESGNVYIPDPSLHSWVHDFIEEFAAFPNDRNDDQVDALSQGLNWMEMNKPQKTGMDYL